MTEGDQAEQPVAADRKPEEVRVVGAAAVDYLAPRGEQAEGLDVADERRHLEAAAVDVGREAAAERELVGAGLLLREGPLALALLLQAGEVGEDLRPLDPGLELDMPFSASKPSTRFMRRVSIIRPSRNCCRPSRGVRPRCSRPLFLLRRAQRCRMASGCRVLDDRHTRGIELRVDIVDQDAGWRLVLLAAWGHTLAGHASVAILRKSLLGTGPSAPRCAMKTIPFTRPAGAKLVSEDAGGTGGGLSMTAVRLARHAHQRAEALPLSSTILFEHVRRPNCGCADVVLAELVLLAFNLGGYHADSLFLGGTLEDVR